MQAPPAYSSVALEELPLCNQGMRLRKLEGFPICKKGPFRISAQQGSQQKRKSHRPFWRPLFHFPSFFLGVHICEA